MSQKALKNLRRYLRIINSESRYDADKKNYKKCNWKQKTIINNSIKKELCQYEKKSQPV
jgi:hypothetical protein